MSGISGLGGVVNADCALINTIQPNSAKVAAIRAHHTEPVAIVSTLQKITNEGGDLFVVCEFALNRAALTFGMTEEVRHDGAGLSMDMQRRKNKPGDDLITLDHAGRMPARRVSLARATRSTRVE